MSDAAFTKQLQIIHTQKSLPFRPLTLLLTNQGNGVCEVSLDIFSSDMTHMIGILTDTTLVTIFEEKYTLENLEFLYFKPGKRFHLISTTTPCRIPPRILRTLYSADVRVKKFILGGTLQICDAPMECTDTFDELEDNPEDVAIAMPEQENASEDFLIAIDALSSSRQILEYMFTFNESHQNRLAPALIELIETSAQTERLFGNNKRTTMLEIQKYLQEHSLFE